MKKLITIMSLAFVGLTFGQEEATFNVSGSVDAYFRANLTSQNDEGGSGDYSAFNNDSGFSAGLANVTLSYEGDTVGFIADLAYNSEIDSYFLIPQ